MIVLELDCIKCKLERHRRYNLTKSIESNGGNIQSKRAKNISKGAMQALQCTCSTRVVASRNRNYLIAVWYLIDVSMLEFVCNTCITCFTQLPCLICSSVRTCHEVRC